MPRVGCWKIDDQGWEGMRNPDELSRELAETLKRTTNLKEVKRAAVLNPRKLSRFENSRNVE